MDQKWNSVSRFFYRVTWPPFQVFVMILTLLIVGFIARMTIRKNVIFEVVSDIHMITPKKIKEWHSAPAQINVGFYIRNFPTFDFVANNFVIDGIVWFEFDPSLIALETIGKFTFSKADLIFKSEPFTKLADNKFFVRYDIRLKFSVDLDYRAFPFDNHRMSIVLENKFVPPSEMVFTSDASLFSISPNIIVQGWQIANKSVLTGYSESALVDDNQSKNILNPKAAFIIDFHRKGIRYVSLIFFPLIIIFFVGLLSFSLDSKDYAQLIVILTIGEMTFLLSYRFVIENLTPRVGYFTFSDQIFLVLMLCAVVEFIFGITVSTFKGITQILAIIRALLYILFIGLFIFAWYYSLYCLVS